MAEREASTKAAVRILIALLVLSAIVAAIVYLTRGPKTTIRITKGRPGVSTLWEAWRGAEENKQAFSATEPIKPEIWRGMKAKIESFRYSGCNGESEPVMEVRYDTKSGDKPPADVDLTAIVRDGEQGSGLYLRWDLPGCSDQTATCTLPAYLFDPTYYGPDEKPCDDPSAMEKWTITLP